MDVVTWGLSPWGQDILLHVSWTLLYVAVAAAALFTVVHALYVRLRPAAAGGAPPSGASAVRAEALPERIARHSGAARLFHWVMAASMIALLVTAFLPLVGVPFGWVTIHWIAGLVLTASILYHIVHASVWMDFWSVWLTREDLDDGWRRLRRAAGQAAPAPRLPGKYPMDNKVFHTLILLTGVAATVTGLLMMTRVRTPFLTRDPYLFADQTWGVMYVLHGVAGIGIVALTMAHVYFAVRPEKLSTTKSMLVGWVPRAQYLEHHDPQRWVIGAAAAAPMDGTPKMRVTPQ